MTSLLYVTDLTYPAQGRRYGDEDVLVTSRLREHFDLALVHPLDAAALLPLFDLVVVRNSGPVIGYPEAYAEFRRRARESGACVYNPLTGRADMAGKQYLVDLTATGAPVIPTVDSAGSVDRLPAAERYVVKPKAGADSLGLRRVERAGLVDVPLDGSLLVQPAVDFAYEVSFYFVDDAFQYALHAPDPARRWELVRYEPSAEDLAFARGFVDWNSLDHGIQRVDACRTASGQLLLMELEDLNPYLSLDLVDEPTRDRFLDAMRHSVEDCLAAHRAGSRAGRP